MRASRVPIAKTGSRLFLVYAIASLLPVLLLGFALSRGDRHEARDRALAQGRVAIASETTTTRHDAPP